jgi:hypothetical protein
LRLLEDLSSSRTPRPPRRRVLATMSVTLLLVVTAAYVGFTMLTGSGDEPDENTPVSMSAWVENASTTCITVAEEHPVLTQSREARLNSDNLDAIESGVDALVTGVRGLPPLEEADDQERVNEVVVVGDTAAEAWHALGSDDASDDEMADASAMISAFIDGLVDLGADCAVLD